MSYRRARAICLGVIAVTVAVLVMRAVAQGKVTELGGASEAAGIPVWAWGIAMLAIVQLLAVGKDLWKTLRQSDEEKDAAVVSGLGREIKGLREEMRELRQELREHHGGLDDARSDLRLFRDRLERAEQHVRDNDKRIRELETWREVHDAGQRG